MTLSLPHPHGNASGQIAHTAQYEVTNTPGSNGGRFIGFGEPGSSAIANRSAWALSENVNYLFGLLSADKALQTGEAFTSTGQSSFHLTESVFTGDSSYPGSGPTDPEGMFNLFAVLDDQYSEIVDAAGNEVQVYAVYETTNTTSCYKQGFVTNPWLHFCTVNPTTGVVIQSTYVIPALQKVRVLYGKKSSLGDLPADAFTRFKVASSQEIPGGVILQDGSRSMLGNLNAGGHSVVNAASVRSTGVLSLWDNNTGDSGIPISQTGVGALPGLVGVNSSILGAFKSNHQMATRFTNRTIVKGGAIVYDTDGGYGRVTLPAGMIVALNGEAVGVGGVSVTLDAYYTGCLVLTATKTLEIKEDMATVLASDAVLADVSFSGTWSVANDLRGSWNKDVGSLDFIVSADPTAGDYTSFMTALRELGYLLTIPILRKATVRIVVRGTISDNYNGDVPSMPELIIVGESGGDSTNGAVLQQESGQGVMHLNDIRLQMQNISTKNVSWSGVGSRSFFENCIMGGNAVDDRLSASCVEVTGDYVQISRCMFQHSDTCGVSAGAAGKYLSIDQCYFYDVGLTTNYAILGTRWGHRVTNCTFELCTNGLDLGTSSYVANCRLIMAADGTTTAYGIRVGCNTGTYPSDPNGISLVTNCRVENAYYGIAVNRDSDYATCAFTHNMITDSRYSIMASFANEGREVTIAHNTIYGDIAGHLGVGIYCASADFNILGNRIENVDSAPIRVTSGTCNISGNKIMNSGRLGTDGIGISVLGGDLYERRTVIADNEYYETDAVSYTTDLSVIYSSRKNTVVRNNHIVLGSSAIPSHAVYIANSYRSSVVGNVLPLTSKDSIYCTAPSILGTMSSLDISDNVLVGAGQGYECIMVLKSNGVSISGNKINTATCTTTRNCGGIRIDVTGGTGVGNSVKNNVIVNLSGRGKDYSPNYWCRIIACASGSTPNIGIEICGNQIMDCGDIASNTRTALVHFDGNNSLISDNSLTGCKGARGSGSSGNNMMCIAVWTGSGNVISNNVIRSDAYTIPDGTFYGVYTGGTSNLIKGNSIFMGDTASVFGYGVMAPVGYNVVNGNMVFMLGAVEGYDIADHYAVFASEHGSVVVGNSSFGRKISVSGSYGDGYALANFCTESHTTIGANSDAHNV